MITKAKLNLKGQYRIKVFGSGDVLKSDTDFIDNLITDSGILFPFDMAFADTFRYLNLGTSTTPPSNSDTGVFSPISEYSYLGAYAAVTAGISNPASPMQIPDDASYSPEGCGTTYQFDSISLFRTWRVPSGVGSATDGNIITEFAVSPSAPIELGIATSGYADTIPFTVKPEHSLAFSRTTGRVVLDAGDYALVTYRLNVYPSTGAAPISVNLNTAGFDHGASDTCTGWLGQLTGVQGIVHAGIKVISGPIPVDTSTELSTHFVPQSPHYGNNYFGVSYTPRVGALLEPSHSTLNDAFDYVAYSSNDLTQFVATPSGGHIDPAIQSRFFPFNPAGIKTSGICGYIYNVLGQSSPVLPNNIRIGSSPSVVGYSVAPNQSTDFPSSTDITVAASPVPSTTNIFNASLNFGVVNRVYGSDTQSRALNFTWLAGVTIPGSPDFISSVVIAHPDIYPPSPSPSVRNTPATLFPVFEMMLNTIDGRCIPPLVVDGSATGFNQWADDTAIKLFFDGTHNLGLSFNISWSRV
jgi:hypothetical protein